MNEQTDDFDDPQEDRFDWEGIDDDWQDGDTTCEDCGGMGYLDDCCETCPRCDGEGYYWWE